MVAALAFIGLIYFKRFYKGCETFHNIFWSILKNFENDTLLKFLLNLYIFHEWVKKQKSLIQNQPPEVFYKKSSW